MSLLIISLPLQEAAPAALYDYVQSPDGSTVAAHGSVPLALLPPTQPRLAEVVAVLPADVLCWHLVQLPQGSLPRSMSGERGGARLRAILDGLLEDQLLDDPSQYHLALQPQPDARGPVWVVAWSRTWLDSGLKALAQAGHQVTRIVPELSVQALADATYVTEQPDGARVVGWLARPGQASAAHGGGVLVAALTASCVGLLEPSQDPDGAAQAAPAIGRVVAEPAVAALAEALFQRPVVLQQRPERLLQAAASPWDLAQFELAHASRNRRWAQVTRHLGSLARSPQWRAARWSLLALLLVNLLGLNAWALREQANLRAQQQQIGAVLTETFPKIAVVVDAPLQMARQVALLQRSRGNPADSDMESILSSFSALAPASYALTAIEYVAQEWRLSGPPMDPQAAAQVSSGLRARGLQASLRGDQWLIVPAVAP